MSQADVTDVSRVAIVSGYFNPLHVGHVRMITAARALADSLVVIVNNDEQQLAKIGTIVQPLAHRVEIVRALRDVDDVVAAVDSGSSVIESLRVIRARYPDAHLVFANGGDRSDPETVAETDACRELAIEVVLGVGGRDKADASSRINRALGRLP
jgi:glycerol-3-phosphate cytidylyltransferase/D-beta-D-heptose 7-phosphate kinase/D-beta-D-heptose 1-phosphate adenosyltransferase